MSSGNHIIFITYLHPDGEVFAKNLVERISTDPKVADIIFWKDGYGLWSRQTEKDLDAVKFLVLIMVITPGAFATSNCKDEWIFARKKGIPLLAVNGLPEDKIFYKSFPAWLENHHVYDLEKQWPRFIHNLNTNPFIEPIPFTAPLLSAIPEYVPRNEKLALIKKKILTSNNEHIVNITSLQGNAGVGKTALAIALCHDDDIINYFDDGILWVTMGEKPGAALDALNKLYHGVTGENILFLDVDEAQEKLAEKLEEKNFLVVIDDVRELQCLIQLMVSLDNSTVLITTRFTYLFPKFRMQLVRIEEMKPVESVTLLTAKFKDKLQGGKPFEKFAKQLGHLPILLKLAGAQLTKWVNEGESPEQALAFVKELYDQKVIAGSYNKDASLRRDAENKVLAASLEMLSRDEMDKLFQLGIFPDNENIAYDIISLLWNFSDVDTEDLLKKLCNLALLDLDHFNKTCSIHEVLMHYYTDQLEKKTVSERHERLIISMGHFKDFKNKYAWNWYIWHLIQAGKIETAKKLLKDFDWIEAKIFAINIAPLLKDYQHFPLDADTKLIYETLKLSANTLTRDRNQLPAQLIGRLGYFENEAAVQLVKRAKEWKKAAWCKPLTPSLARLGVRSKILKGHSDSICSLSAHDGKIISGSEEGDIHIWEINTGHCLQTLHGHTEAIISMLVYQSKIISWSEDKTIHIWDTDSGKCLRTLHGHTEPVRALFIEQGKIISGSSDGTIRVWEMETGQCRHILKGHVKGITFLVHQDKIISGLTDNTIGIWEIESGRLIETLRGHTKAVRSLLVKDGKLISGSLDTTIRIWELDSGECLSTLTGHTLWVNLLLIQEGKIISASGDDTIRIWETASGRCLQTLRGHTQWMDSLCVYEGKIISGSQDGTIRIWDIVSGQCLRTIQGHTCPIGSLLIHDGKIICCSLDNNIQIWDIKSGLCIQIIKGHTDIISSLLVHEGIIISGSDDKTIRIWETGIRQSIQPPQEHIDSISEVLIEEDKIISASWDSTIRIWEKKSGYNLQTLHGHTGKINLLLAHDGKIISGSSDKTIRIWEIASGLCLQVLQGHTGEIDSLLIHNGKIISGSYDTTIRIWEMNTGQCLFKLQGHTGKISKLMVHENKIISGSYDNTVRIWDVESGQCLLQLQGHEAWISTLVVNKGKIISGSLDGVIRIWEIEFGRCLKILRGHSDMIESLFVHEDKIISGSSDSIRIWEIDSGRCLQMLQKQTATFCAVMVHMDKIISRSFDGLIHIWEIESGHCLHTLYEHKDLIGRLMVQDGKLISGDREGLLIVYDVDTFMEIARYYSDAAYTSEIIYDNNRIISGDGSGKLHILEMIEG